jgi:hypothetical protein
MCDNFNSTRRTPNFIIKYSIKKSHKIEKSRPEEFYDFFKEQKQIALANFSTAGVAQYRIYHIIGT